MSTESPVDRLSSPSVLSERTLDDRCGLLDNYDALVSIYELDYLSLDGPCDTRTVLTALKRHNFIIEHPQPDNATLA
jgi:hypothetical protein